MVKKYALYACLALSSSATFSPLVANNNIIIKLASKDIIQKRLQIAGFQDLTVKAGLIEKIYAHPSLLAIQANINFAYENNELHKENQSPSTIDAFETDKMSIRKRKTLQILKIVLQDDLQACKSLQE